MIFGKYIESGLSLCEAADDSRQHLIADGFKETVILAAPEVTGLQGIKDRYTETEDKIVVSYEVVDNDPVKVKHEIERLKSLLDKDDYKITKCYESSIVGEPLPYDINQLHAERQSLRAQIRDLETIINQNK